MGNGKRLIWKQVIKYFVMLLVFLIAIFLGKVIWSLDLKVHIWGLATAVAIFLIMVAFDLASATDIIPIFKR